MDAYAEGYFKFNCDMGAASDWNHGGDVDQTFPVEVSFVPMLAPSGSGKIILAENLNWWIFWRWNFTGDWPLETFPDRVTTADGISL